MKENMFRFRTILVSSMFPKDSTHMSARTVQKHVTEIQCNQTDNERKHVKVPHHISFFYVSERFHVYVRQNGCCLPLIW